MSFANVYSDFNLTNTFSITFWSDVSISRNKMCSYNLTKTDDNQPEKSVQHSHQKTH